MSTNNAVVQGRVNSVHDRVNALTSRVNQPMTCGSCGSTHFYVVRAEEFSDSGYNSAQLRSLTMNQDALYVCLCGAPVPLKDTSVGKGSESGRARFLKSLQLALDYQRKNNTQSLAKGVVSLGEHEELKEQLATVQEQVDWLMSAVEQLSGEETEEEANGEMDEEASATSKSEPEETPETAASAPKEQTTRRGGKGKNKN